METKYVYCLRQTQPENDYQCETIAVFTDKERANKLARRLNKEYGKDCVFDKDWNFIKTEYDGDPHYYDVDCLELNPKEEVFL